MSDTCSLTDTTHSTPTQPTSVSDEEGVPVHFLSCTCSKFGVLEIGTGSFNLQNRDATIEAADLSLTLSSGFNMAHAHDLGLAFRKAHLWKRPLCVNSHQC